MICDLKKLRENTSLTQKDLADILGIDQSQISRYEADPSSVGAELYFRWVSALGVRVQLGGEVESAAPAVDPGAPYEELGRRLTLLEDYCGFSAPASSGELGGRGLPDAHELKQLVASLRRKPSIALIGKFDAGKSKTANGVLGQEYLPTNYQPATKLITFVRHLDDRPAWMAEDVWVMGPDFKFDLANDQEHCQQHRIVAGNLETLRDYGTYGGRHEDSSASAALVYLPSPVLKACNVIDLPGFRNDPENADQDGRRASEAFSMADVVLYVSAMAGFIDGNDLGNLSNLIRCLPPFEVESPNFPNLGQLFIIATHVHPGVKDQDITLALDKASHRLFEQIKDTALRNRGKNTGRTYTQADVRARMFPFWAETESRRRDLREALRVCVKDHIPLALHSNANRRISEFRTRANHQLGAQLDAYTKILEDMASAKKRFEVLLAEQPARQERSARQRRRVEHAIDDVASKSAVEWTREYDSVVNADNLERLITKRFSKLDDGKNEAKRYAPSYVLEILQGKLGDIIQTHSQSLTGEVEKFLGEFTDESGFIAGSDVPFDAKGAFVGGLAGAGVVGALAIWAASLGNLGGYILAAKAVGVLSSVGIGISGGTAGAMSLVSAIGGPVTLAVGAFVLIGLAAWSLFGASWESRLAKKLEKDFDAQQMKQKLSASLAGYWNNTRTSFGKAADAVEARYKAELDNLRSIVENPQTSRAGIEKARDAARDLLGFFGNMPWKPM